MAKPIELRTEWWPVTDLDELVERCHQALDEFVKGNPDPVQKLYSHREDVTLANPFGTVARGWEAVRDGLSLAASRFRDGRAVSFETLATYAAADLASTVEIERYVAKFAGRELGEPLALRVTSVYRREDGMWRLIARHADPRVGLQPIASVFSK